MVRILLLLLLAACSVDELIVDAAVDANEDAAADDAAADVPEDTVGDAQADASLDVQIDVPTDTATDVGIMRLGIGGTVSEPPRPDLRVFVLWAAEDAAVSSRVVGTMGDMLFEAEIRSPPRAELTPGFALGFVVAHPDAPMARFEDAHGAAPRQVIVYRESDAVAPLPWVAEFPVGLSCGEGVEEAEGFDSFQPADCSSFEIQITDDLESLDWVNWS